MTATGRKQLRPDQEKSYCQGCGIRITLGQPSASDGWASRLSLTREQSDLLLEAAAEFVAMGEEWASFAEKCGDPIPPPPTAVEFVDWMSVDALRSGVNDAPHWDGAPPRNLAGEITARGHDVAHRHPDPIPYAPIRRTRP